MISWFLSTRIGRAYRVAATGLSFSMFGVGALLLALVVFPVVRMMQVVKIDTAVMLRGTVSMAFRCFLRLMWVLGIMNYRVSDRQALKNCKGRLIIANHPTLIDVVFLIAYLPNANCVVKSQLLKNPFTRGVVSGVGYIANGNANDVVDMAVSSLQDGANIVVFPEGTRTVPGKQVNEMKRGVANIALSAGIDRILPMLIKCTPATLFKGQPWYRVPKKPFQLRLQVLDSKCLIKEISLDDRPSKAARQLTRHFERFYQEQIDAA